MRVATWNIGGGFVKSNSGKYDTCNIDYISRTLKEQGIDIIFLQEAHTAYSAGNER